MPLNLGVGEILLIAIVALIVLGPEKLPEIGAAVGKALYEFRRASADVSSALFGQSAVDTAPRPAPPSPGRPCVACGAFISTERRFCSVCGTDQDTLTPATSDGSGGVVASDGGLVSSDALSSLAAAPAVVESSPRPWSLSERPADEDLPTPFAPEAPAYGASEETAPATPALDLPSPEVARGETLRPRRTGRRPTRRDEGDQSSPQPSMTRPGETSGEVADEPKRPRRRVSVRRRAKAPSDEESRPADATSEVAAASASAEEPPSKRRARKPRRRTPPVIPEES